jgi:FkbM family methyltransferase
MSLRIKFIQFLLNINEKIFFYPRLKRYYKKAIDEKDPIILDVGANRGQSIFFFLDLFPNAKIIAFEPNYKLYEKLIQKFRHLPNVQLVNKGISNKKGKLVLKETATDETSTFEELNYESGYLKMKSRVLGVKPENLVVDSYEVDVIRLFDFIEEEQIKKIHVVKIDTEGHELKCLLGLFLGNNSVIDIIQLEHHHDDMYVNSINYNKMITFLKEKGFFIHKKIHHGFGDFDEMLFKRLEE